MDTTPNIAPTAPEKPAAEATPKACPKKKGCGVAILLLTLLAIAGAGASVFFYLDNHNQSQEITKLKNSISTYESSANESAVDEAMIQNLIDPYLVSDGAYSKVFAQNFDEDAKVKIAFYNLNPYYIGSGSDSRNYPIVYTNYFSLRDMYNRLFGSEKALEKKDYGSITYEEQSDRYTHPGFAWGGAGRLPVVAIKDYTVSGDTIVVDVVYDNPVFCDIVRSAGEGDLDYCVEGGSIAKKEDVADFLEKAQDKMPVYRFTFEKDAEVFDTDINAGNGRYVLKNIEQQ